MHDSYSIRSRKVKKVDYIPIKFLERILDFCNDFMASIDDKFKSMKSDIDLYLAVHTKEIESLSQSIDFLLGRIEKPKHIRTADQSSCSPGYVNNAGNPMYYVVDMDVKVIATNVRFDESESILQFARDPINHLDESVNVVAVNWVSLRLLFHH